MYTYMLYSAWLLLTNLIWLFGSYLLIINNWLMVLIVVDHLAHVFDYFRNELKADAGKELFINYQATPVILYHFKPSNKVKTVNTLYSTELIWIYMYGDIIHVCTILF